MKKAFFLFMLISVLSISAQTKTDSKISEVVVFSNGQANVTREVKIKLDKGKNKIILTNLSNDLIDESVKILSGESKNIKVTDIQVEKKYSTEAYTERIKAANLKIDSLTRKIKVLKDEIIVLDNKKELLESIKSQAKNINGQKVQTGQISFRNWDEMLAYYGTGLSNLLTSKRKIGYNIYDLENEVKTIENGSKIQKDGELTKFKEIIIDVESERTLSYDFNISYLINNAAWYAQYDARIGKDKKDMDLSYLGLLRQSTGEDWDNVKLSLSTAEPSLNKALPVLTPWIIDLRDDKIIKKNNTQELRTGYNPIYDYDPDLPQGKGSISGYITDLQTGDELIGATVEVMGSTKGAQTDGKGKFLIREIPTGKLSLKVHYIGYKTMIFNMEIISQRRANCSIKLPSDDIQVNAVEVYAERKLNLEELKEDTQKRMQDLYSKIKNSDMSTTFELPVKYSIPSDNNPHQVLISERKMPVSVEYISYPKIEAAVFLKARINNSLGFPLMPGKANIFIENDFITRTDIFALAPKDTMNLSLGVESKIKISKKLINRFLETGNLFSKKNTLTLEYEIEVMNNKETEETIKIFDQIPVSVNDNIKVELMKPDFKFGKNLLEKTLNWEVKLKPGEKRVLPISFKIEYPEDIFLYGLEN